MKDALCRFQTDPAVILELEKVERDQLEDLENLGLTSSDAEDILKMMVEYSDEERDKCGISHVKVQGICLSEAQISRILRFKAEDMIAASLQLEVEAIHNAHRYGVKPETDEGADDA